MTDETMKTIRETIGTFDAAIHGTTISPMTARLLSSSASQTVVHGTTELRIVLQDGLTTQEIRAEPILR